MLDASLLLLKYRSESYDGDRFHQYCQNRVRRGMQQLASPKKQQGLVAQASLGKHVDMKQFWVEGVLATAGLPRGNTTPLETLEKMLASTTPSEQ